MLTYGSMNNACVKEHTQRRRPHMLLQHLKARPGSREWRFHKITHETAIVSNSNR